MNHRGEDANEISGERRRPGQHGVDGRAQPVDVRAHVQSRELAKRLLGRHERGSAQQVAVDRQLRRLFPAVLGQAEVSEQGFA